MNSEHNSGVKVNSKTWLSRLGDFEIESLIGAGGMGEVYRARDLRLRREVAIKVLPAFLASDGERLRRFEQEANVTAALNHPNIIAIFQMGTHEGAPYLVSELLEGETLRERIKRGCLVLNKALDYAEQVARGLSAAHEHGIVHRDLKPENLFITRDGRIKILDFGLARLMVRQPAYSAVTAGEGTEPGMVMGTVGYMAPEQVRGEPADHRADIFALGAILYEMLVGQRAFRKPTAAETMSAILNEEPAAISQLSTNIPPAVARIVHRCLEKNPEQRFQSASDLAFALKALSDSGTTAAGSVKAEPRSKMRGLRIAVLGTTVLIAAFVVWWLKRSPAVDSIAVLPFVNAEANPSAEYLTDGITDGVIQSLAELPGMQVRARTSVFQFKAKNVDVRAVGHQLGVKAILTGTVRSRGDDLDIRADLIDVASGSELWGEHYQRKFAEVARLQDEIGSQIAQRLHIRMNGEQQRRLGRPVTTNVAAYDLYLKGLYDSNQRTDESTARALDFFQHAVALDPNFALAYVGIADCYAVRVNSRFMRESQVGNRDKVAVEKALALDPDLGEAHASLSTIKTNEFDWAGAENELRRAIDLNPNYATAHLWYAVLLMDLKRLPEAERELVSARELDPLNVAIKLDQEVELPLLQGNFQEVIRNGEQVFKSNPYDSFIPLMEAYTLLGKKAKAFAIMKAYYESAGDAEMQQAIERAFARGGAEGAAKAELAVILRRSNSHYVSGTDIALRYALLGDKKEAVAWLQKAFERNDDLSDWINDPAFGLLESDPNFNALVRRMNLPWARSSASGSERKGLAYRPAA